MSLRQVWSVFWLSFLSLLLAGCFTSSGSLNEQELGGKGRQLQSKLYRYSVNPNQTFEIPRSDLSGEPPYQFLIEQGIGKIDASSGLYTAPEVLGYAVVSITDSAKNQMYATIEVVDDLRVKNPTITMPVGAVNFVDVSGGKYPYSYTIDKGPLSVNKIGLVESGLQPGTGQVKVTDSLGNSVPVSVSIVEGLGLQPTEFAVIISGSQQFTISGATGVTRFSVEGGQGSMANTPPVFTAGTTTGTAVVMAEDELKTASHAFGTIYGPLAISPTLLRWGKNKTFEQFQALGGVPPYKFSVVGQGAIEEATGKYTSSDEPGTDVIKVTDSLGNSVTANVEMTEDSPFYVENTIVVASETIDFAPYIHGEHGPYTLEVVSGGGAVSGLSYTAGAQAGMASIKVTDAVGRSQESTIFVYPQLNLIASKTEAPTNEWVHLAVRGGIPPIAFRWFPEKERLMPKLGRLEREAKKGLSLSEPSMRKIIPKTL